ncbi:hypothetical protein [uncultured Mucilaginibacter sp.]|uniref:hypothetical protein n=1 Tax=uncultured Mucilaginibacter sp. TaxID=797541 RepID=UPI0025D056B6|nr:hypothetical protein [uncultured Mucilaginibacter sp.]
MSFTSWLKKIWKQIKALFDRIPSEIKSALHIGVVVTENLKIFVESPIADLLTAVIPGHIDDRIKQILREKLPILLTQLKLADTCSNSANANEVVSCAIEQLKLMDGNLRNATLHNLSVLISQLASDGKLDWKDGAYVMEWYYQHEFKSKVI